MAKILMIDDDRDLVASMKILLEAHGHEFHAMPNGEAGLRAVREISPDLIVLDVMMETGTAGFHVAYQVRKDPNYAKTPILMLTAIHQTTPLRFSPETDGEFLPVEKLLDKPVPADVLLAEVAHLLGSAE